MPVDPRFAHLAQLSSTGRGLQLDLWQLLGGSFEGNAALGAVQKALLWLQAAQVLRFMRRKQLAFSKITCNAPW